MNGSIRRPVLSPMVCQYCYQNEYAHSHIDDLSSKRGRETGEMYVFIYCPVRAIHLSLFYDDILIDIISQLKVLLGLLRRQCMTTDHIGFDFEATYKRFIKIFSTLNDLRSPKSKCPLPFLAVMCIKSIDVVIRLHIFVNEPNQLHRLVISRQQTGENRNRCRYMIKFHRLPITLCIQQWRYCPLSGRQLCFQTNRWVSWKLLKTCRH